VSDELRLPPHSIDAEQSVLGALLLHPDAYDRIDWLLPDAFFRQAHQRIYGAIVALLERGRPVDPVIVSEALRASGDLDKIGGKEYIEALALNSMGASNIRTYAELVRDTHRLRGVMATAQDALAAAGEFGANGLAVAERAEASFLAILDDKSGSEFTFEQAVKAAIEERENPTKTIPTGIGNIDRMLKGGGMKPGQLIVVAGRPSMGKSALAWNIAEHIATRQHVAGFSLEMPAPEIADRALEYHSRLTDQSRAALHLMDLRMSIDDSPAVTLAHIRLRSRRMKRKHGLALIVVDYLQLMESKGDTREQEIAKISRGLKALAKELQVPVIAVAQLNRSVEGRADRRPMMSDLRESGALEQDADVVLMLYRDDYYNPDTQAPGIAEAIFRKQRGGRTGTAYLKFDGETTRFHDYTGPAPIYAEARAHRVANFNDYKTRQAGDE
jgi:replicative DNA helicase